jgi:hypothetical protein
MHSKEARIQAAKFLHLRRVLAAGGDNFRWVGRGGYRLTILGRKPKSKTP